MSATVIDLRRESNAIRRVSLLLDHLRDDGYDADLAMLDSQVSALQQAATDGKLVQRNALSELARTVASRLPLLPRPCRSVTELLRSSVFIETDELLQRLVAS